MLLWEDSLQVAVNERLCLFYDELEAAAEASTAITYMAESSRDSHCTWFQCLCQTVGLNAFESPRSTAVASTDTQASGTAWLGKVQGQCNRWSTPVPSAQLLAWPSLHRTSLRAGGWHRSSQRHLRLEQPAPIPTPLQRAQKTHTTFFTSMLTF